MHRARSVWLKTGRRRRCLILKDLSMHSRSRVKARLSDAGAAHETSSGPLTVWILLSGEETPSG